MLIRWETLEPVDIAPGLWQRHVALEHFSVALQEFAGRHYDSDLHANPAPEAGYVLSGELEARLGDAVMAISAGESYYMSRDTVHRIRVCVPTQCIIFFLTPAPQDRGEADASRGRPHMKIDWAGVPHEHLSDDRVRRQLEFDEFYFTLHEYRQGYTRGRHAHPEGQFGHVLQGRMRVWIEDESIEQSAGVSVFVPGGAPHRLAVLDETTVLNVYVKPPA